MIVNLNGVQLVNELDFDLEKGITRTEAKAVHKDLPEGGVWRTIRGHHVYLVNGQVVAGSIPGVKVKAKKATKAQLQEHQEHIDKEAKKTTSKTKTAASKKAGAKKDGSKGNAKATDTKQAKPTGTGKKSTTSSKGKGTAKAGTGTQSKAEGKGVKKDAKTTKASEKRTPKAAETVRKEPKLVVDGTRPGSKKPAGKSAAATKSGGTKGTAKKVSEGTSKTKVAKEPTDVAPKKPTAKTKTVKGKGAGKDATKPTDTKGTGKSVPKPGAKKGASEDRTKSKSAAKKVAPSKKDSVAKPVPKKTAKKDIRSDAQKNRELAYDVGDKVGGARKDDWEKNFKYDPNLNTLADLEKDSPAVAQKLVTKKNVLPEFSFEQEHAKGAELPTAILKKLIFDRIAPKPTDDTPEARQAYVHGINKLYRHFEGVKTLENMKNAVREMSDLAGRIDNYKDAKRSLDDYHANPSRYSYFNEEYAQKRMEQNAHAVGQMDFGALGDKLHGFFTSYKSREATIKTVVKNMKDGWDKYLSPEAKKAPKKESGEENKKWERKAEAEHLRTGGKNVTMNKPEELMKNFGVRGVEFGNWVNDSSGKYHLQRSAEAFHDLADTLGIDPNDVSLNGRLAIAFGARGKGTALAHYEPDRKVINMTKYGGAGSLAHEWGHAMDNILYQYSHGGKESMNLASDGVGDMGDHDPKLKTLYQNVMDAIMKPTPGDKGAVKTIQLDSSAKPPGRYYPEMRRDVTGGMSPEDVYNKWTAKVHEKHDRQADRIKANSLGYRTPEQIAKDMKKNEASRKRELNALPHYLAAEMKYKNGGYGGEHYKGEINVPTGVSEYHQRMIDTDGSGKSYWSQGAEMFARVFESYVQHKLDKEKRYNNYLVHGTREGNVKVEGAPFPIGKEREHMFKAMDNLMKHVASKKTLKKALEMDMLMRTDLTGEITMEELRKSMGKLARSAYEVDWTSFDDPIDEVLYIPLNRLKTPHQTELALNHDKIQENYERMVRGEALAPIVIGFDHDVHDGHHRYEASHLADYTHVPCVVMQTPNEIERRRAIESYQEIWKGFHYPAHTQHHHGHHGHHETHTDEETGELGKEAFEENENFIYRGIGQRELDFIKKNGFVASKGKGNDADKNTSYTCFSTLYSQAMGYARSNYDLYGEKQAYVIAIPKPDHLRAVDGEIVAKGETSSEGMMVIPIPKEIS